MFLEQTLTKKLMPSILIFKFDPDTLCQNEGGISVDFYLNWTTLILKVSQTFLEQTLDKKLMSNMRLKKSSHERQAGLISSGEWSSGKL